MKIHISSLLSIFLIITLTSQNCKEGCLKCTAADLCTICDITSNYMLKTGTGECSKVDQPNCKIINLDGGCLACDSNYWLNPSTLKCVEVEKEKKVENCISYSNSQVCLGCQEGFIINSAKCVEVIVKIENCINYKSNIFCSQCKNGFVVSLDEKTCETFTTVSNCSLLSRFQCNSCAKNFILNKNLYFKTSFLTNTFTEKNNLLQKILNYQNKSQAFENPVQCERVNIENCSEFEAFNQCKICSPGSFPTADKTCQAFPHKNIPNCQIYSSNTNCQQCNQGYFRASSSECKQIISVENCLEYSQTSSSTICTKCSDDFYIATNTSCLARDISALSKISNCLSKSPNSDKCFDCNSGFVLSSSGDECVTALSNCLIHNIFSTGSVPTCNTCIQGHYLSGECIPGSDVNCETFFNSGSCQICKHKYFHDGNNACFEHETISECKDYSKTLKNTCEVCEGFNFNFDLQKKCKLLTEIPNCATYNHDENNATTDTASCETCKSGYFKDTSVCNVINVANCDKGTSSSVCTDCLAGFVKYTVNSTVQCKAPHDFMSEKCESIENTGGNTFELNDVTCANCKINALPINYENNYACISNDLLKDENTTNMADGNLISDCLKYDVTGATPTCTLCDKGKYLANNRQSCETSCGSGIGYSAMTIDTSGQDNFVEFYNICNSGADNSAINVPDKENLATKILKCAANMITAISTSIYKLDEIIYSSNVSLDGSFGNYVQDLGTTNPVVECYNIATNDIVSTKNFVDNCEYYIELSSNNYGCNKCVHGYHGKGNASSTDEGEYIISCHIMESCDINAEYNNLEANFGVFFSCHKCKNPNKIPYLFYNGNTNNDIEWSDWLPYTLNEANNFSAQNDNHNIECIDNTSKETFLSDVGSNSTNTINLLENCALGLFDIDTFNVKSSVVSTDINTLFPSNTSILCAACKPGYKPQLRPRIKTVTTGGNSYNYLNVALGSCDKIQNCDNSTWFNACSKCNSGYVYKFGDLVLIKSDGTDETIPDSILYDECIEHKDYETCFASNAVDGNCSACRKGFVLNKDGNCVVINTPKCQENQFVPYTVSSNNWNYGYLLWYNEKGAGCNQCQSGYTAVKYNAAYYQKLSCTNSFVDKMNLMKFPVKNDGTVSDYIDDCESYEVNSNANLKCTKCNDNFAKRDNGLDCIYLSNCKIANNTADTCKECHMGYSLFNNLCVLGNIANCATYNTTVNDIRVVCSKCNDKFYLNNNICNSSAVDNCEDYGNSKDSCLLCKTGYLKISNNDLTTGAHDYCYKLNENLNCKDGFIQNNTSVGAQFTCSSCIVPYSVFEIPAADEIQTLCMNYTLIQNCETYNIGTSLALSTFLCSKCADDYYLKDDGFRCIKRIVKPQNCKIYTLDSDTCSTCNEGYFISSNGKECVIYPIGEIGCRTYTDATTCTACDTDYWLSEGKCIAVLFEAQIPNCLYYSNGTVCSICKSDYLLDVEKNTCESVNVSNCIKIKTVDECEVCEQGYRLVTEINVTNCQAHTKPNCKTYNQSGEKNECLLCNQNYYIDTLGDCASVNDIIQNCLVNDTSTTCSSCLTRFALAKDKKSCIDVSFFDSSCENVSEAQNLVCSQCNPGYYFEENVCSAFEKDIKGCFSRDINNQNFCLVCNPGYYMNKSFDCIENVKIIDPVDPVVPDSLNRIRSLLVLVLLVVIL